MLGDQPAASPATVGHAPERAHRREVAVFVDAPAEQLLRVGVDRIQIPAIAGDGFVAHALLAFPVEAATASRSARLPSSAIA